MPLITIAAANLNDWQGNANGVFLLIYTNEDFTAQSGAIHPKSVRENPQSLGTFLKSIACTVANNVLSIPAVVLDSTEDSPDNPGATYSAAFFDSASGKVVQPFGTKRDFTVPAAPAQTSWTTIFAGEAEE